MEQEQQPHETTPSSLFQMNLDAQSSYSLRGMASWAKVLGITSFIAAGLCIIFGIIIQQRLSQLEEYGYGYRRSASGVAGMGLAVYVIMAALYGISGLFAFNTGNKINEGLKSNDMQTLNSGFAAARNFFALWAILTILFVLLMFLGLAGSV